ncbi:MAG: TetR/AcrR family transcriptional regulator [Kofleriaceae bacterium]
MPATRRYNSPLREEQMEQTRDRILAQVAEILSSPDDVVLTVALAAERARVSVRTAYRYFPTKELLIDEFNAWMTGRFNTVASPTTLDQLPDYVASLYAAFANHEQLVRASRRSQQGADVRRRRKAEQLRNTNKLIAAAMPDLDPSDVSRVSANLVVIFGSDAWIQLRDQGMSNAECVEIARWGIDALATKLRKLNQAVKGKR